MAAAPRATRQTGRHAPREPSPPAHGRLALAGSVTLLFFHPQGSPRWAIWGNLAAQLMSHGLTGAMWGPWQAKLSREERGPRSPYLGKILATHWIRTLLINLYGAILLLWAIRVLG